MTNLAFNVRDPILLVGDTHGGVTLAKLSPNLHKGNKKKPFSNFLPYFFINLLFFLAGPDLSKYEDPKKIPEELKNISVEDFEKEKMENILVVAAKWEREDWWLFLINLYVGVCLIIQIFIYDKFLNFTNL